ncbi:ABC transporter ATP-binding protein [Desulforhabdus amnigena]|uniref:ABC transporter ATP-binding protein n=1 Tax=Desulforhabdus amnigena TaxID=40218 RepID=A0A9W6FV41_9BACT|nr:ABC transporter ATP-binding protein [Desulforhabdus amnigena]NLJ28128.1 ABC transporter ATP-binding protein [Deltaproteobacteria bacterium]GLI35480.1 ABC transporter ATP-binding protein [Desulforhabdus amnigena]
MLYIHDLSFAYGSSLILDSIGVTVERKQILSIVGPNGAGKTTLLKCMAGILKPTGGAIRIEDRQASSMSRKELAARLGYVPQSIPSRFSMTVFDTVLTGRRPHAVWRPSQKDMIKVAEILHEMNLDELAMREMDRLSGGQAQKVLLARALAQEPSYMLLDEPTSSLDLRHQMEVLELMAVLVESRGMGAVMAMHDLNLAARFSHKMVMLREGKVFCSGSPREVLHAGNIRTVYGVEAAVNWENGYPLIQVLRCVSNGREHDGPWAGHAQRLIGTTQPMRR